MKTMTVVQAAGAARAGVGSDSRATQCREFTSIQSNRELMTILGGHPAVAIAIGIAVGVAVGASNAVVGHVVANWADFKEGFSEGFNLQN